MGERILPTNEILFNDQLAENVYRRGTGAEISYVKLAGYLDASAHKNPDMKILEVGAGTKCTIYPECIRSRRKLTRCQLKQHWMIRHGRPTTPYEVHESCRDSLRKYSKYIVSIYMLLHKRLRCSTEETQSRESVLQADQSRTLRPYLNCSSSSFVDNTKIYHPTALKEHQRIHTFTKKKKKHPWNEKECEGIDELFDEKALQGTSLDPLCKIKGLLLSILTTA